MSLNVALVAPEGEIWTGAARQVIAKTLDGDIGILTGHTPVLGILAEGSLVRICRRPSVLPVEDELSQRRLPPAG